MLAVSIVHQEDKDDMERLSGFLQRCPGGEGPSHTVTTTEGHIRALLQSVAHPEIGLRQTLVQSRQTGSPSFSKGF